METLEAHEVNARDRARRAANIIHDVETEHRRSNAMLAPCREAIAHADSFARFVARIWLGFVDPDEVARAAKAIRGRT